MALSWLSGDLTSRQTHRKAQCGTCCLAVRAAQGTLLPSVSVLPQAVSSKHQQRWGLPVALLLLLRLRAGFPAVLPGGGLASVDEAWDEGGLYF